MNAAALTYSNFIDPIGGNTTFDTLGFPVQMMIAELVSKSQPSNLTSSTSYKYFFEQYNWNDDTFILTLYPNGTCKIFDQSVSDRDTHTNYSLFGIYTMTDSVIEIDAVFYYHSYGWNVSEYYQEVKTKHYIFNKQQNGKDIYSNINQFEACCADTPVTLSLIS